MVFHAVPPESNRQGQTAQSFRSLSRSVPVISRGMSDEKQNFSRRLAEAMEAKGYEPKPGVLHTIPN